MFGIGRRVFLSLLCSLFFRRKGQSSSRSYYSHSLALSCCRCECVDLTIQEAIQSSKGIEVRSGYCAAEARPRIGRRKQFTGSVPVSWDLFVEIEIEGKLVFSFHNGKWHVAGRVYWIALSDNILGED